MRMILASFAAVAILAAPVFVEPAHAQNRGQDHSQNRGQERSGNRGDQANARQELQAGRNMPIREIERQIMPRMKGDEYLGFEYDRVARAYRLKFIREGRVIWIDVDARTARVLRISR